MRDNRSWNPNTKYGRRKNRERAARNYRNASPKEKAELDSMGCIAGIILFIIAAIVILAKAAINQK